MDAEAIDNTVRDKEGCVDSNGLASGGFEASLDCCESGD
jgi:hypothetical protein